MNIAKNRANLIIDINLFIIVVELRINKINHSLMTS